jgi:hypothetical protein
MKANELRIGNYLNGRQGHVVISEIRTNNSVKIHDNTSSFYVGICLIPIKITEEWLEKFGFEKNKDKRWMRGKSRYAIFYFEYYATGEDNCMWRIEYHDTDYGRNEYKDCNQWGDRIKYVHQLQNLYFALTGEELTIKC